MSVELKYGKPNTGGKKYLLPQTSGLLGEESFADVALGWQEEGVFARMTVHHPFEEAIYPKYEEGNAIEMFFDTRDLKESGFSTRFCHHFLILPQEVQGIRALELSRFRTEDSHPLCDPASIEIHTEHHPKSFVVDTHFPAEILHGYDPRSFDRLGFTYCIHRPKRKAQHFAVSSRDIALAQHPSLWATCQLTR
jgi:hypothetical protein